MKRFLEVLVCAALTLPCQAQDTGPVQSIERSDLAKILGFAQTICNC